MKKFLKHTLAVLLAVVMIFGGAPLAGLIGIKESGVAGVFDVEAQSATIYTLSYNANGGIDAPATQTGSTCYTISTTVPSRFGYHFVGWSDTKVYDGKGYRTPGATISITKNTTLYAIWEEKDITNVIYLNDSIDGSNEKFYFKTTPTISAIYCFKTGSLSDGFDPQATLYNSSGVELAFDDDSGEGRNFCLTYDMKAGTTYYLEIKGYSGSTGGFRLYHYDSLYYDANGGANAPVTQTSEEFYTVSSTLPTRDGYRFMGWSTNKNANSAEYQAGDTIQVTEPTTIYAVWSKIPTYTVSYNANGGSGAPSAQTKTQDTTLWISSTKPTKSYTVTYNANGGSVSPSSKTVSCTFKNWNTAQNGSGTSYSSGASYTANSGATLYAQWTNPTYGTLPTPSRTGYTFDGWYTSASGGTKVTSSSTVSSNTTLYAHWSKEKEDIYNLGEETYSFPNYGDYDSPGGHCFGMSVTSSAYYLKELDIASVGGNYEQDVYALNSTTAVKSPICYYQDIQDSRRDRSMVAGGSYYKNGRSNISSDWTEVVNYVKNHNYDNIGTLQIGFRKDGEGGHAINFLYYAEVDGQPRIYAYDNNYPNVETYFYMDSNGNVKQAPRSTFSGAIDCIALRSVPKYFDLLEGFDTTRYIYADKDTISIEGTTVYALEGGVEMGERVMYEVPANVNQVKIKPLVDNAEFEYLDESYSFGSINDDTVGVFTLASSNDEGGVSSPGLTIENESKSIWDIIADFFMMIINLLFGWLL